MNCPTKSPKAEIKSKKHNACIDTLYSSSELAYSLAGLFPVLKDGLLQYMDSSGKILIYTNLEVEIDPDKWFSDDSNKVFVFSSDRYKFSDGMVIVKNNYYPFSYFFGDEFDCIDFSGEKIFSLDYYNVWNFSEGLAQIKVRKRILFFHSIYKYGYINKSGQVEIKPRYDYAGPFKEGLAAVRIDRKSGYINRCDSMVITAKYDFAREFSGGLACVLINKKWGYINRRGELEIDAVYDWGFPFHDGLARIRVNGKIGYINSSGKILIKPKFDWAYDFFDGLACVKYQDKMGFIDSSGQFSISAKYSRAGSFNDGLAPVLIKGKWGYIDTQGQLRLDALYDRAYPFTNGLAMVIYNDNLYYINTNGDIVSEIEF